MILEQVTRYNFAEMAKMLKTKIGKMSATVQHLHEVQVEENHIVRVLHDKNISMDNNIKVLMRKMGILIGGAPSTTIEHKQNTQAPPLEQMIHRQPQHVTPNPNLH